MFSCFYLPQKGLLVSKKSELPRKEVSFSLAKILEQPIRWSRCPEEPPLWPPAQQGCLHNWRTGMLQWLGCWPDWLQMWLRPMEKAHSHPGSHLLQVHSYIPVLIQVPTGTYLKPSIPGFKKTKGLCCTQLLRMKKNESNFVLRTCS